jgi:hypothetical protein
MTIEQLEYKINHERFYDILKNYYNKDYVEVIKITTADLNLIKNDKYCLYEFLEMFKNSRKIYKELLPDFLKKNPEWLEYFI